MDAERQLVGPRRRRHLLHAGHRQSAVRHGAQRGRGAAVTMPTPLLLDLNWDAPFRGVGTANDCGVQPPLVCLTNDYVLGNMPDRKTPYMVAVLFNVQRELGGATAIEIGYLGSRSYRLERMFDCERGDPRGPASCRAAGRIRNSPRSRRSGTWPRPSTTRWRSSSLGVSTMDCRCSVGYTLSKSDGQRQRHPRAQRRRAVPAEQQLLRVRVGAVDLRRAAPLRDVGALRAAVRPRQAVHAGRRRRRDFRRLADQRDHQQVERLPERPGRRHGHPQHRRRHLPSEPRVWPGSQ